MATNSNHDVINELPIQSIELCDCDGQSIAMTRDLLTSGDVIENFFTLAMNELIGLRTRADIDSISHAARLILDREASGGRVHVTGVGKSEYVARYIASLLSSTGTPAYFLNATESTHGSAGQVCNSDVTIAISKSGATAELMLAVNTLRGMGTKIIGVSSDHNSSLAGASDVFLHAAVNNEGGELNLAPRTSVLANLYILCALTVVLEVQKGLTREQYAQWHPCGSLGRLARGEYSKG